MVSAPFFFLEQLIENRIRSWSS